MEHIIIATSGCIVPGFFYSFLVSHEAALHVYSFQEKSSDLKNYT